MPVSALRLLAAGAVALLFGAVSLLLAITVSNISSLMLAQLDQRGREIAIRLGLSLAMVDAHRRRIRLKLNHPAPTQLVEFCSPMWIMR